MDSFFQAWVEVAWNFLAGKPGRLNCARLRESPREELAAGRKRAGA